MLHAARSINLTFFVPCISCNVMIKLPKEVANLTRLNGNIEFIKCEEGDHQMSEERMKVLAMLQEGKITVAQANQLLEVLDAGTTRGREQDQPQVKKERKENIQGATQYSLQQIIELREHDVDPGYIKSLQAIGMTNLTVPQIIQLREHDIEPTYIKALYEAGFTTLSVGQIAQLGEHDVPPLYLKALHDAGFGNLPLSQIIELVEHDVDPSYLRSLDKAGLSAIAPQQAERVTLPEEWTQRDIGAVFVGGHASYENGAFSVGGYGSDVWEREDQGYFVFQELEGDGSLVARLTEMPPAHEYSKGGLMIRSGLDSGDELVFLAAFHRGNVQVEAGSATTTGIREVWSRGSQRRPRWMRLDRIGNMVTVSVMEERDKWVQGPQIPFPSGRVYIGLFSVAHGALSINTATFDNVNLSKGTTTDAVVANGELPSAWRKTDIGPVRAPANVGFQNGVFSIQAAGADVYQQLDEGGFVYQVLPGDGVITARVSSQSASHDFAKAGLMIRDSLQSGANLALFALTPCGMAQISAGSATDARQIGYPSGTIHISAGNPKGLGQIGNTWTSGGTKIRPPHWLSLQRISGTLTAYTSPDGVTWSQQAQVAFPQGPAYIGLFNNSHNPLLFNTATFDNVEVSGARPVDAE